MSIEIQEGETVDFYIKDVGTFKAVFIKWIGEFHVDVKYEGGIWRAWKNCVEKI